MTDEYSPIEVWLAGFVVVVIAVVAVALPRAIATLIGIAAAGIVVPFIVGVLVLILWEVINDL